MVGFKERQRGGERERGTRGRGDTESMGSILYLLSAILVVWIGGVPTVKAQTTDTTRVTVRYDSSAIAVRSVSAEALSEFLIDPDFQYDRDAVGTLTWWERFKRWLGDKVFGPLDGVNTRPVTKWVIYIMAACGIFFAITQLLRMDLGHVFSRKRAGTSVAFEDVVEDIAGMDFDLLIAEATAARDYRRAVRLLYLKTLKTLAANDLIDWQRDKTNHEYIDELRRASLRPPFTELTTLFEYIWYGDFPVDERIFDRTRIRFSRFEEALEQGEEV